MKPFFWKKVVALSFSLILGTSCLQISSFSDSSLEMVAFAGDSVSFADGTLTLYGEVVLDEVRAYSSNPDVHYVVAAEGTVFPSDCSRMFASFLAESWDLSNADTSRVTNMDRMFELCTNLTELNLSSFDTSLVTNMYGMFEVCANLTELDLSSFDTSLVTNIGDMFSGCRSLESLDLSGFNTERVADMRDTFSGCSGLKYLDLSSFNTALVTNTSQMFWGCSSLKMIYIGLDWTTENVSDSSNMFYNCYLLRGGKGTYFNKNYTDGLYARNDLGTELPGYLTIFMFDENATALLEGTTLKIRGNVIASDVRNCNPYDVRSIIAEEGTVLPEDCTNLFGAFEDVKSIDLSKADTSNVTNMNGMFNNCVELTELDLSNFNTSKVTSMVWMFYTCPRLEKLNLSNFDISSISDKNELCGVGGLFYCANALQTVYVPSAWKVSDDQPTYLTYVYTLSLPDSMEIVTDAPSVQKVGDKYLNGATITLRYKEEVLENDLLTVDCNGDVIYPENGIYTIVIGDDDVVVHTEQISKTDITGARLTVNPVAYSYDGEEHTVSARLKMPDGTILKYGEDFTLSGNSATEKGSYTLTVEGIGRYYGKVSATWRISELYCVTATVDGVTTATYYEDHTTAVFKSTGKGVWKINGVVRSVRNRLAFSVLGETEVEWVSAENCLNFDEYENSAIVNCEIADRLLLDDGSTMIKTYATWSLPEGATLVEAGIAYRLLDNEAAVPTAEELYSYERYSRSDAKTANGTHLFSGGISVEYASNYTLYETAYAVFTINGENHIRYSEVVSSK